MSHDDDSPRLSRDDKRRERRDRYAKDDLGPSVVGFGDHLPAFLTIAVPRIWETPARPEPEAAAPTPGEAAEAA